MALRDRISEVRRAQGMDQKDLAARMNVSRESVSKWEQKKLEIPEDLRGNLTALLDDGPFTAYMWSKATNGASIPYLDGVMVDHHPAALLDRAQKEVDEAEASLRLLDAHIPHQYWNGPQRTALHEANRECLDAMAALFTLISDNCAAAGISVNDEIKQWRKVLPGRKWTKEA